jgi:membrane protease YdiL (CAAX protease family)
LLYGFGWLAVRPLALLAPGLRVDQLDLLGVVLAFALLLLSLPARLRRAWGEIHPWRRLGLTGPPAATGRAFLRGLIKALLLLGGVAVLLLISGQARWGGSLGAGAWLNALALLLGVGFAEELLFRGWLWGELELETGSRRALLLQALIFALLHPWYRAPGLAAVGLLGGLILLGLALALQRRADGGLLWGAVGLHGGLVGGWFALQTGLLQLAPDTPAWLGGLDAGGGTNPLAGLPGWLGLALLLLARRRWW